MYREILYSDITLAVLIPSCILITRYRENSSVDCLADYRTVWVFIGDQRQRTFL